MAGELSVANVLSAPLPLGVIGSVTNTCLFKYTENCTTKNENVQMKNCDIFS